MVNGCMVHVFAEIDPSKIPWDSVGVNYVIEATESLNLKIDARLHLQLSDSDKTFKDIVKSKTTVKKVIVGNSSSDVPSFGIGINDDKISSRLPVLGHVSAPASALVIPLKIIHEHFGIRFC